MIIGIDASRANEEKKTGVGWYAYNVIQELKHLSTPQEMRFVLYTNKPLQGELANLPENWEEKVLGWKLGRLWTQVRLSFEMLVNPPDVLFIPAHVFPIIHPKKTVMTIHDVAAVKFPESYNWFERWYTLWSAKFALKRLWKVIVPSEFTKKELESLKVESKKDEIKVVYHGYNEEYKKIEDNIKIENVLIKYNISKPYLLSIGRLEEKKNTINIIKAFEKLKIDSKFKIQNSKLVLVGGEGHGFEKVMEAIDNSQFKNDIITLGWVENEDLPYLMNGADVFVFPSLYEGFGIPVLEAQACGIPVITSGGYPSTSLRTATQEVGGDACLYVDPQSVDEIVEGVLRFHNTDFIPLGYHCSLRMQIVEKGFENIKRFSWEKCAKETLNVLINKD